ncbi:sigma-54-dependent Fis family transcriptional regulator [Rhizobiales bacterium]|uniref:sigma-54-dependent transcriptional regulator n=1 Tax=Hongsoonwoonella zoysiae TaxID=2821844 RepID=UPI00155F9811|nr:sigma-54 dependent transcriptional regulator [Hongsoonwoonella zoysiae]NRG19471.1 sigma-54-dependent Fis family transcriptional regulator [Hongsoonwoonella zoysiae]
MAKARAKVLLVEDTVSLATAYAAYLEPEAADVEIAGTAAEALSALSGTAPDVIVLDVKLPDMDGLELLGRIKADGLASEVVVITGQASVNLAVEAMRKGAFDFIMKPFSADRLRVTVMNAIKHRKLSDRIEEIGEAFDRDRFQGLIGRSFVMQTTYRVLQNAASTDATVFITGESGTGKELCARALHDLGKRRTGPFITLNCAAIPRDLLESEIFGHARGAFTGAVSERKGAVLSADGGTLFLDEVCEMDLALQSKMLRFLQERSIRRVGEDHARSADVRIVCASNRDPLQEVASGRFREDLYYRLHVVPVELPPLRERDDDVLIIARALLSEFAREDGKRFKDLSPEVEAAFLNYSWPGNVRQLQNVIRTAVVLNDAEQLELSMLPGELRALACAAPAVARIGGRASSNTGVSEGQGDCREGAILPLDTVIREAIESAIDRCGGSIPKAAAALKVSPSTIYRRLQAWEETPDRQQPRESGN